MMIGMVIFWTAIVLAVIWIANGGFGGATSRRMGTPIDVLERTFAQGAMSVDEYRRRREILEHGDV